MMPGSSTWLHLKLESGQHKQQRPRASPTPCFRLVSQPTQKSCSWSTQGPFLQKVRFSSIVFYELTCVLLQSCIRKCTGFIAASPMPVRESKKAKAEILLSAINSILWSLRKCVFTNELPSASNNETSLKDDQALIQEPTWLQRCRSHRKHIPTSYNDFIIILANSNNNETKC